MATFDSAYLLGVFNRLAARPAADGVTDPTKYQWLSEAQNEIVATLAAICPQVLYPTASYATLPTMSTTDNQVFTFGTDSNGYPIAPIGKVWIGDDLTGLLDNPWQLNVDYYDEGTQIRIPNNQTWTQPIYWYGIKPPADIDASHQPALFPAASRMLIPHLAVMNFSNARGDANRAAAMREVLGKPWGPVENPEKVGMFARWCLTWRSAFRSGGALGGMVTQRDLAILNQ